MSNAQSYVLCFPSAHVARTDASGTTVAVGFGVQSHPGSWYMSPPPRATVDRRTFGPMLIRVSDGVLPVVLQVTNKSNGSAAMGMAQQGL